MAKKRRRRKLPALPEAPVSTLKCGSGAAWVKDKTKFFKVARQIRRGMRRGWWEIEIVVATRDGAKMRKVVVEPDAIKYLPRKAGPYQPVLMDLNAPNKKGTPRS